MFTLLESIAVRSFVILLLTTLAAAFYRDRSAAVLHRIWTLGLIGCLLVPIVTLTSPEWELAVLPARSALPAQVSSVLPSEPQAIGSGTRSFERWSSERMLPRDALPSQMEYRSSRQQTVLSVPADLSVDTESNPLDLKKGNASETISSASSPSLEVVICWTWLTVAGFLIVLGLVQWIRVKQMLRRCQTLQSERWQEMRNDVCDLLGVNRQVTLMSSQHATSPMVTGVFRTWLIVPERARNWADDRVKMVLLHELAHVKRHDLLTHTIASVACAVNWFNPLAWYARRQMQTLREIACDDQVVTHCKQSADYADTLLDVARTCRHQSLAMTVAMARTHKVEGRIIAILDSARNRTGLNRTSALLLVAMFAVLIGVTGSLQLKAIAQSPVTTVAQTSDQKLDGSESDSTSISPQLETSKPKEKGVDPSETRTMRIRVLDEKGKPLLNATVYKSVWEIDDKDKFPNKEYQTDEQGEVDIKLPKQIRILRLWPSKPGYVGQFLNFAKGTHRLGELIPDSYEFRLQPGNRLSGLVVDTNGDPIVDAKVSG